MKRFFAPSWQQLVLVLLLSFTLAVPQEVLAAKSAVKLQKWSGEIDFAVGQTIPFTLAGNASHLGKFTAYGEVEFQPVGDDGSFLGLGEVVFTSANGDLLVGKVTWRADAEEDDLLSSSIHFQWVDSVTVDGKTVSNTGRFVDDRPPGLVVIAIIAILIGLLLPAVQK